MKHTVDTGNMNANDIAIVTGTMNINGLTCICTAYDDEQYKSIKCKLIYDIN